MIVLYKQSDGKIISIDEKSQKTTMPTASVDLVGKIIQYVGTTDVNYTSGYFYKCVADTTTESISYKWEQTDVQPDGGGSADFPTGGTTGQALIKASNADNDVEWGDVDKIQVDILPTADADNVGTIYQFIGATTLTYINGYFYKCISDTSTTPVTYKWEPYDTQSRNIYPMWTGTQTEHDAEVLADTLPYNAIIGITDDNGENITWYSRNDTGAETLITTGSSGAMIDDYHTTSATTWSSQKITNAIATGTPVMTGAATGTDGEKGFVPKPVAGDDQKALFGDGRYHTVYTSASGSTIIVQTDETDLYGKTVTLTAGAITKTATISNTGEAVFTDISHYGMATVEADDGNGNIARGSVALTYFGNYVVGLGFKFSTIIWESTNIDLAGKPLGVFIGNREVGTVTLTLVIGTMNTLRAAMYVDTLGTYKINTITSVGKARGSVTIDALRQTKIANVDIGEVYAFKINKNDSNPATCVTDYDSEYGCDNKNFVSAHMDYTNDVFDYGSWTGQEFFFPRPCMLRYDGTVAYYLNPDDYSQRADGVTASDVDDMEYNGNVMVEFLTIYFKRWEDTDYHYCIISDKQLDADFHAWAHHDTNGNVLPYIYLSAYDGSYDGTRLRSISGIAYHNKNTLTVGKIMSNTTRQQEIDFAQANNLTGYTGEGWYIRHKADWDMINDLLILIGMSTDTQTTFGRGRDTGYSSATNTGVSTTGLMDDKGLFYGRNDGTIGVKVFGIEQWWGNIWRPVAGWINDKGTQKIKMTYGREDGSTVDGFNMDGTGYVVISNSTPTGTTGGYINTYITSEYGLVPKQASGSASTYLCDRMNFDNRLVDFAYVGGTSNDKSGPCGAFASSLDGNAPRNGWYIGSSITYKGIAS